MNGTGASRALGLSGNICIAQSESGYNHYTKSFVTLNNNDASELFMNYANGQYNIYFIYHNCKVGDIIRISGGTWVLRIIYLS